MVLNRLTALRIAYQNNPRLKKPRKLLRRTWLAVSGSLRAFLGLKSYREIECEGLTFTLEKRNTRRAFWFALASVLLSLFAFHASRLPNPEWKTSLLVSPMLVRNGPGAMTDADRNRIVDELRYVKPSLLKKLLATDLSIGVIDHESDLTESDVLRQESWPVLINDAKNNSERYRQSGEDAPYVSNGRFGLLKKKRTLRELEEEYHLEEHREQFLGLVRILNKFESIDIDQVLEIDTLVPSISETPEGSGAKWEKKLLTRHDHGTLRRWLTPEGKFSSAHSIKGQYFFLHGKNKILVTRDGLEEIDHLVLHELGHAVEKAFRWSESEEFASFQEALQAAYESAGDRPFEVSQYSRRSKTEYFAEGFANYYSRPARLWLVDRRLYQLVGQVIEQLDETTPSELKQQTLARKEKYKTNTGSQVKNRLASWRSSQDLSPNCCARHPD